MGVTALTGKPAVFLDRDGVIIRRLLADDGTPRSPRVPEEVEIPAGVHQACAFLRDAGFLLVLVTNQPEVARRSATRADVEQLNASLANELALDSVGVCYHADTDGCECRKPRPGLLLAASRDLGIDLHRSFMVGDRWRDIAAGQAAGCRTVLVDGLEEGRPMRPDHRAESLWDAARWIHEQANVASTREGA